MSDSSSSNDPGTEDCGCNAQNTDTPGSLAIRTLKWIRHDAAYKAPEDMALAARRWLTKIDRTLAAIEIMRAQREPSEIPESLSAAERRLTMLRTLRQWLRELFVLGPHRPTVTFITELSTQMLDAWVAKLAGASFEVDTPGEARECYVSIGPHRCRLSEFCPSSNWAHGGPIIEWERITLRPLDADVGWEALVTRADDTLVTSSATTPLRAAMLCVVRAHYGAQVEGNPWD